MRAFDGDFDNIGRDDLIHCDLMKSVTKGTKDYTIPLLIFKNALGILALPVGITSRWFDYTWPK
jgi:hypothetical protein